MTNGIMPATLVGSVVDDNTMVGIVRAAVRIAEEPERGTIYALDGGTFFFQGIRQPYVTLRVSAAGYPSKDQRVNITSSTVYTAVFYNWPHKLDHMLRWKTGYNLEHMEGQSDVQETPAA